MVCMAAAAAARRAPGAWPMLRSSEMASGGYHPLAASDVDDAEAEAEAGMMMMSEEQIQSLTPNNNPVTADAVGRDSVPLSNPPTTRGPGASSGCGAAGRSSTTSAGGARGGASGGGGGVATEQRYRTERGAYTAQRSRQIEEQLNELETTWSGLALSYSPGAGDSTTAMIETVQLPAQLVETLDEGLLQLQVLLQSKYLTRGLENQVAQWQRKLDKVDKTLRKAWITAQEKWTALRPVLAQLKSDSAGALDTQWKALMKLAAGQTDPIVAAQIEGLQPHLEELLGELDRAERSLNGYLETHKAAFPRFYFVAPADLLDILANGHSSPWLLQKHFSKVFDSINGLCLSEGYAEKKARARRRKRAAESARAPQTSSGGKGMRVCRLREEQEGRSAPQVTRLATGMTSGGMESVEFHAPLLCEGDPSVWLSKLIDCMRLTLRHCQAVAFKSLRDTPRHQWQLAHCAQIAVLVSRIVYTGDVDDCFAKLQAGVASAFSDYRNQLQQQLGELSNLIRRELSKNERKQTITLVTVDVHARDVVDRLIQCRVDEVDCFQWQSQLRYQQREGDCLINICDYSTPYSYEYIGNCGTLVITPLTDRAYITLTQAAQLVLGGPLAGPSGTGKTETTKDLGRALGIMVYMFICSDQMNYRVMANIYKGLAQTGCWGCFDAFDCIAIEVLSVCSIQYKTLLDGLRAQREAGGREAGQLTFTFDGEHVPLFETCMAFITMNPGNADRTELPESLKTLFRPVSMVKPDMDLITEIILFSEGFVRCKFLARKFMLCYGLATDLLSKADHYDWKLRAVKTTLAVAGAMMRAAPDLSEDKVLLRCLRDFNIGKLLRDDVGIFLGLLNDLFPMSWCRHSSAAQRSVPLELVPRARDQDFEVVIRECAVTKGYQPETGCVLKVTQLREIFEVRWSVFLLGPAGCGKSVVAEILMDSQNKFGERGMIKAHNPKAVTRNELYGFVSTATREWNDGLLSQIFRDYSNDSSCQHQWIILDGDIDAEWIATMSTVMDDNKILTLVSGERIPLTPSMRLLFEITDLRNASPAMVSRAGVIYINDDDIGWSPIAQSWVDTRPDHSQRAHLRLLVRKYVQKTLGACKQFKQIVPILTVNSVSTLCYLLDGVLGKGDDAKKGLSAEVVETYFVWAMIWAFGGALLVDKAKDHKEHFSRWWQQEFKTVTFPSQGNVFDYIVDEISVDLLHVSSERGHSRINTLVDWACDDYIHTPGQPVSNLYVDVSETARLTYIFNLLVRNHKGVMYTGNAGTGKTVCMQKNIKALDEDEYVYAMMNLNSKTDSMTLQAIMERVLEKKAGITFGPPGNKHIVYYIDDLNMPFVDKYGTQEPIAFLRCFVDYELMYEREKLGPRKVKNCEIVASLNPTAGSFIVDGRFQRQFATFSCQLPRAESLGTIYGSIFDNHLQDFDPEIAEAGKAVVIAAGELQVSVANTFLPSAVKFHYIFNLRDISNVFGGMLRSESRFCSEPANLVELFIHEANRVYRDQMVETDLRRFDDMLTEAVKKSFGAIKGCENVLEKTPLIFTNFCSGGKLNRELRWADEQQPYLRVKSWEQLKGVLQGQLDEYNETNAVMNLVLFNDAMEHVSRIARIIDQPRGNALLVGVGGSGKQSLARLAAYICTYEVYQIQISAAYNMTAFLEDLQIMYKKAGVKGLGVLFLFTDQQIVNEQMLVYLNDMLLSGDIPGLFSTDDVDNICNSVRNEVKQAGLIDTPDACWDFFIQKTRRNLHTALAFSPVGDAFRIRMREFPALLSGTMIVWFHAWSTNAMITVANKFLEDLTTGEKPLFDAELQAALANHMARVHTSVTESSLKFRETQHRFNYTTPKLFLELIALYRSMLESKVGEIDARKEKLESGLEKLQVTSEMVAELQESLVGEMAVVEEKQVATEALLVHVGQATSAAEEQKSAASVEEAAADEIAQEVAAVQADVDKDLEAARPALQAAEAALDSLDKGSHPGSLGELKRFGSPADAVVMVTSATLILTAGKPKVPKDLSWAAAKRMMDDTDQFFDNLVNFDKDNVDEVLVAAVETKFLPNPEFEVENIRSKSSAAAGLCSWCVNICKYFRIYQMVAPKRAMLAAANDKLNAANKKLEGLRAMLAELDAKLQKLTDQAEAATAEKNAAIAQAEKTQAKANLALRLVNGLASEGVRWDSTILITNRALPRRPSTP
jgi:dynein heavy chain